MWFSEVNGSYYIPDPSKLTYEDPAFSICDICIIFIWDWVTLWHYRCDKYIHRVNNYKSVLVRVSMPQIGMDLLYVHKGTKATRNENMFPIYSFVYFKGFMCTILCVWVDRCHLGQRLQCQSNRSAFMLNNRKLWRLLPPLCITTHSFRLFLKRQRPLAKELPGTTLNPNFFCL